MPKELGFQLILNSTRNKLANGKVVGYRFKVKNSPEASSYPSRIFKVSES